MENYEINEETMAVLPINEHCSKIYETDSVFYVNKGTTAIMEDSCLYFGSTLDGRRKGTQDMIGVNYKAPIIVEESKEMIFFPTSSSRYHDSVWISLKHIHNYYMENNFLVIEFENQQKVYLKYSYGIIDNQILRATRLESPLRGQKKKKKRFK